MENKLLENEEKVNESTEVIEEIRTEESSVEGNVEEIKAEETAEPVVEETAAEEIAKEAAQTEPEIEVAPVEEIVTTSEGKASAAASLESEEKVSFFKTPKWKRIWDKITTVLLIGIMATPILILIYILAYFLTK